MIQALSRRTFLGVTAGAAAATWLRVPRALAGAEYSPEKYGGFLMGIQSYSLRNFNLDQAIKYAQELGVAHLELFQSHLSTTATPEQIDEAKKKLQDAGLKVFAHGVNNFGANNDANRKLFEFAKRLGLREISADPAPNSFDSLDKLVAEFDIRIAIHNHGPGARYSKVDDVLNAIKDHEPRIGACADLGHYIRSDEDPVTVIKALQGRLYGVHLKDFAEKTRNAKGVILGKGQLDLVAVFKALREVKFPADGCLSLEYEENPRDPINDIRECLKATSDAAVKSLAKGD